MNPNSFENRHIGLNNEDVETMLSCIGLDSIDQLITGYVEQQPK